jgi:transcriptional regulator with XRE-family HTH domain
MGNRRGAGMYPVLKFGNMLRKYREGAGFSLERLGERMGYTGSFIGQVERGERPPLREFAERGDKALDIGKALTWLWDELLASRDFFPEWFDWPDYEAKATVLRTFQLSVVDGLLQTEDYARALLSGDETAVAARIGRQEVLTREALPRLYCLLSEAVLRYQVGSRETMRVQLDRLLEPGSAVSLQIVPEGLVHPGLGGAFVLATLPDESDVAYVATPVRGLTLTGRDDVRGLARAFDEIRSLALPTNLSRDLITTIAEERWS